jgi:hypothetical protein
VADARSRSGSPLWQDASEVKGDNVSNDCTGIMLTRKRLVVSEHHYQGLHYQLQLRDVLSSLSRCVAVRSLGRINHLELPLASWTNALTLCLMSLGYIDGWRADTMKCSG